MDRSMVRDMVEDYWRTLLPAMQSGDQNVAADIGARFEERVEQTAALLEPVEAAAFLQAVEAERERLIGEYSTNPVGLKQRLGVSLGVDAAPARTGYTGENLGDLAVRTVVRATIWESIWALFRAAR